MVEKRHLPVITTSGTDEPAPPRSAPRWILLGTLLVVVVWLPLGMLGLWISRLASAVLGWSGVENLPGVRTLGLFVGILPIIGSFMLAAAFGGGVVARFGPPAAARKAHFVGGLAGAAVASLAAVQGALRPWQLGAVAYATLILLGVAGAAWGRRWGRGLGNAANLTSSTRS